MRRSLVPVVLVALLALHVGADAAWHYADAGVQYTDAAYHHGRVVDIWRALRDPETRALLEDRQRYGDLGYYVAAAVARVTGPEPRSLLPMLGVLLWPVLLLGGYRLGWELAPRRRRLAGLLSAALLGFIPGVFNYARVLVLDLPLTAAVLVAVLGLLGSRDPDKGRRATSIALALLGTAAVVGLKVNGLVFVAGPALLLAAPGWSRRGLGVVAFGVALVALILATGDRAAALAQTLGEATWPGTAVAYARDGHLADLPGDWARHVRAHTWDAVYYTVLQTLTPALGLGLALASLPWWRRGRHRRLVLAWTLPGLALLLLGLRGLWDERYVLPLLPPLAAAAGAGLASLRSPALRRCLAALAVAGSAAVFLLVSFPLLPTLRPLACATIPSWGGSERTGAIWACALHPAYVFLDRPSTPQPAHPAFDALAAVLHDVSQQRGERLHGAFLDETYDLFYAFHQIEHMRPGDAVADDLLLLTRCHDEAALIAAHGSVAAVEELLRARDFLVIRWNEGAGTPYGRRCDLFGRLQNDFVPQADVPLGDGTSARVYVRGSRALTEPPPGPPPPGRR